MSEEGKTKESKILLSIVTKMAPVISYYLFVLEGGFQSAPPKASTIINQIFQKIAWFVGDQLGVNSKELYLFIQPRIVEFKKEWAGDIVGTEDDNPKIQEKLLEILNEALDNIEKEVRIARFLVVEPVIFDGIKFLPKSEILVNYSSKEELLDIQKRFGDSLELVKY